MDIRHTLSFLAHECVQHQYIPVSISEQHTSHPHITKTSASSITRIIKNIGMMINVDLHESTSTATINITSDIFTPGEIPGEVSNFTRVTRSLGQRKMHSSLETLLRIGIVRHI